MDFEKLWDMEKSFWLDGPDFYERSLAADARMVFPTPVGILAGEQIIESLTQAPRWDSVVFHDRTQACIESTSVLAYKATGQRSGQEPYVALCASTYVKVDGRWVLIAHQQTPES